MAGRVLIVDDEEAIRFSLRGILEDEGMEVLEAATAEEGLAGADSGAPDLVFLDIWLPGMDGMSALRQLRANHPELPVVMISGHGTIETAVSAIREGAYDFIEKPLSLDKILIVAERAVEASRLRRENLALRTSLPPEEKLLGQSPVMLEFRSQLERVAATDAWVLLTGENGTGKELAARALHAGSRRAGAPLIAVNCAAIPEELIESELFGHEKGAFTGAESVRRGHFEMASRGTLFLDEIGDMSLRTQAKILRILQEQSFERLGGSRTVHVDVRVVAATNKNLEAAIANGTFREDLYYRLRVVPLHLPPLRERGVDIPLLLDFFIRRFSRRHGVRPPSFSPDAALALLHYSWPGNVRELRNFVERMVILHPGKCVDTDGLPCEMRPGKVCDATPSAGSSAADTIRNSPPEDPYQDDFALSPLPEVELSSSGRSGEIFPDALFLDSGLDFKKARAAFEVRYLSAMLQRCGGNITRLAEAVGLERSYLHRKLKNYGID